MRLSLGLPVRRWDPVLHPRDGWRVDGLLQGDSTMKEKQQGFCLGGGRGRSEGEGHGVQVGLVFSGRTLGAQ